MNQSYIYIGASELIELTWGADWSDFTMLQDGKPIAKIQNKENLKVARSYRTNNGKIITPLLQNDQLELWCDGRDVISGMKSGRQNGFSTACKAMNFLGGALVFIGLLFGLNGFIWVALAICIVGFIYLYLAWQANKTNNKKYLRIGSFIFMFIPVGRIFRPYFRDAFDNGIGSPRGNKLQVFNKDENIPQT